MIGRIVASALGVAHLRAMTGSDRIALIAIHLGSCALFAAGCTTPPRADDAGHPLDAPIDGGVASDAGGGPPVFETDFDLDTFERAREALVSPDLGTHTATLTADGRWTGSVVREADGTVRRTLSRDGVVVRTTVWSPDGLVAADYDDDDDGRAEVHVDIRRGPTVADQLVLVTERAESESVISERTTYVRTDEETVHVIIERPRDGELVVVDEFDTTALQAAPLLRPLDPNGVASCESEESARAVAAALSGAVVQGLSCMERIDPGTHRCMLDHLLTHDVAVHCTDSGSLYAQVGVLDTLVGPFDGSIDIDVHETRFFALGETSQAATLFHEMLHICRGVHDPRNIASGVPQNYNDPISACTATCFGDTAGASPISNRCTCAVCIGADRCDARCAGLPDCAVDLTECDNSCVGQRTVYSTPSECEGACPNLCKGGGCWTYSDSSCP